MDEGEFRRLRRVAKLARAVDEGRALYEVGMFVEAMDRDVEPIVSREVLEWIYDARFTTPPSPVMMGLMETVVRETLDAVRRQLKDDLKDAPAAPLREVWRRVSQFADDFEDSRDE